MELIDRQALIATLGIKEECSECVYTTLIHCGLDAANACDAIMNAPTIKAEPKWIPCSERLPDRFGKMLVTFIPAAGTLWTQVIIANYSDLMGIAKPCFWIGNVGKNDFENINSQVVAWMPLPEPYKMDEVEE